MNQVVLLMKFQNKYLDRSFAGGGVRNQTGTYNNWSAQSAASTE